MNPLTAMWRKVTYRTEHSNPDPAAGLAVTSGRWGGRTVHDPRVPGYLNARRIRLLRGGFDSMDMALLDPGTTALLASTAAELKARSAPREAVTVR